jgi:hypothetical protein
MGEEIENSNENISRMFSGKRTELSSDEELALHIIHKFNICSDTLESMPAFDDHLKPLFLKTKEK